MVKEYGLSIFLNNIYNFSKMRLSFGPTCGVGIRQQIRRGKALRDFLFAVKENM